MRSRHMAALIIITNLLILVVLGACSPAISLSDIPTIPATVPCTLNPSEICLPSASPTCEHYPTPIIILPSEISNYFSIGVDVVSLYNLGNIELPASHEIFPRDYVFSDGTYIICELSTDNSYGAVTIRSYSINGGKEIEGFVDSDPINDFDITVNNSTFRTNIGSMTNIIDDLSMFGSPITDITTKENTISFKRVVTYDGIVMTYHRATSESSKDLWWLTDTVLTNDNFITSRGVKVGMAIGEVLRRYASQKFVVEVNGNSGKISELDVVVSPITTTEAGHIYIKVTDGLCSAIEFRPVSGD
jgi:hypothetical protein